VNDQHAKCVALRYNYTPEPNTSFDLAGTKRSSLILEIAMTVDLRVSYPASGVEHYTQ
jgi:hypothetical protein